MIKKPIVVYFLDLACPIHNKNIPDGHASVLQSFSSDDTPVQLSAAAPWVTTFLVRICFPMPQLWLQVVQLSHEAHMQSPMSMGIDC